MKEPNDPSQAALILASSSPRRRELLGLLGISFRVVPSSIDETLVDGEAPEAHVQRLARAKAHDVARQVPGFWVIGADTVVVLGDRILGKPLDRDDARTMLSLLADQTHRVYTGYALAHPCFPEKERVRSVCSEVTMRHLSAEEIDGYVDSGEPMGKAGAYAIQGIGAAIVSTVAGSYTNVVGLPLCEVAADLQALGIFDFLRRDRQP
ncbi:MAG: septum formation inhibitor Maf [Desulfomonile tiedjei]|nr:septum formation inhibitor Maf [Desulfomonile tiedjei]